MTLTTTSFGWLGESIFHRPFQQVQATVDCAVMDAGLSRPLKKCLRLVVEGYKAVVGFVVCLVLSIHPLAIFRRIRTVIIDTIKEKIGIIGGFIVLYKISNIKPSVADGNSPPAVSVIADISRLEASVFHAVPDVVKRVPREAMSFWARFSQFTSAGCRLLIAKAATWYDLFYSAITYAFPLGITPPLFWMKLQNQKAAKSLVREINMPWLHSPTLHNDRRSCNG